MCSANPIHSLVLKQVFWLIPNSLGQFKESTGETADNGCEGNKNLTDVRVNSCVYVSKSVK